MSQSTTAPRAIAWSATFADMRKGLWLPSFVVIALAVFFAVETDSFATLRNITALSGEAASLLVACLGTSFVVLMGSIDLSVGAIVLLSGAVSVTIMNAFGLGNSILPIAVVIGGALGLVNGAIYVFGGIPSFVVTLGSLSIFTGLGLNLLQGRAVEYTNYNWITGSI